MGKRNSRDDRDAYKGSRALTKSDLYSEDYRMTPEFSSEDVHSESDVEYCPQREISCEQEEICCSRETCLREAPTNRRKMPAKYFSYASCACDYYSKVYGKNDKKNETVLKANRRRSYYLGSGDESCLDCKFNTLNSHTKSKNLSIYSLVVRPKFLAKSVKSPVPEPSRNRKYSPQKIKPLRPIGEIFDEKAFCERMVGETIRKTNTAKPVRRHESFNKQSNGKMRSRNEQRGLDNHPAIRSQILDEHKLKRRESFENSHLKRVPRLYPEYTHSIHRSISRMTDSIVSRIYGTFRRRNNAKPPQLSPCHEVDGEPPSNGRRVTDDSGRQRTAYQSKEQRKQIKTLKNEIERLRSTCGDSISKSEVNFSDVQWSPGDVLGEGTFSTVYKGTFCGTDVAVKELKRKLSQDDQNYFQSEAALLQQLHHPRIVLLMGVCTSSSRPFMLLEYLSGGTLYEFIHEKTRERVDHAAYFGIAKDIAQGVNYLHKHNPQVLHLDLKSMNVLLDNYTRAKIADFGFSILKRTRDTPVQKGFIRGTPAWMAPELLTKGEVSPKCDVYSYAIILWEMLAAARPFEGFDLYGIIEMIEDSGRPTLPKIGVSRELKELISSCWAQNASLRPCFEEILGVLESASLPSSWRSVLSKANIAPSELSNVTTARTLISLIKESAEVIENLDTKSRLRDKTYGRISDVRKENFGRKVNSSAKNSNNSRRRISSNDKEVIREPETRVSRRDSYSKSNFRKEKRKIDNTRPCSSESPSPSRKGLRRQEKVKSSSKRREELHDDNERSQRKRTARRSFRKREYSEYQSIRRGRREKMDGRNVNLSPNHSQYSKNRRVKRKDSEQRRKSNDTSHRRSRRRDDGLVNGRNYSSEGSTERSTNEYSGDEANVNESCGSVSCHSDEELESLTSLHELYEPKMPQRYLSPSPGRGKSPQLRNKSHRNYSPKKPTNQKGMNGLDKTCTIGGLAVTANELMNQKKRLRKVRPSELQDLSKLDENSLNSISLILKRAMAQRRDALEHDNIGFDQFDSRNLCSWSEVY